MSQMSDSIVVAAIQAAPVAFDLSKSIQKVAEFTSKAAAAGANLVVFPCVFAPSNFTKIGS